MANSSSSDESSKAPVNFQLSSASTNDDEDDVDVRDGPGYNSSNNTKKHHPSGDVRVKPTAGASRASANATASGATVAATAGAAAAAAACSGLRCPMCCKQQRRLHCRACVKNGNITHSSADRIEWLYTHIRTHTHADK